MMTFSLDTFTVLGWKEYDNIHPPSSSFILKHQVEIISVLAELEQQLSACEYRKQRRRNVRAQILTFLWDFARGWWCIDSLKPTYYSLRGVAHEACVLKFQETRHENAGRLTKLPSPGGSGEIIALPVSWCCPKFLASLDLLMHHCSLCLHLHTSSFTVMSFALSSKDTWPLPTSSK